MIDGWGISCKITLRWMPLDLTDDKSTLVQVMAWCLTAPSRYLSQCWLRYMPSYSITRPQWVNQNPICIIDNNHDSVQFFKIFISSWKKPGVRQGCRLSLAYASVHLGSRSGAISVISYFLRSLVADHRVGCLDRANGYCKLGGSFGIKDTVRSLPTEVVCFKNIKKR